MFASTLVSINISLEQPCRNHMLQCPKIRAMFLLCLESRLVESLEFQGRKVALLDCSTSKQYWLHLTYIVVPVALPLINRQVHLWKNIYVYVGIHAYKRLQVTSQLSHYHLLLCHNPQILGKKKQRNETIRYSRPKSGEGYKMGSY